VGRFCLCNPFRLSNIIFSSIGKNRFTFFLQNYFFQKKLLTIYSFSTYATIYNKTVLLMKRTYRELNDDTKQRISQALKGRGLTDNHKQAISDGMRAYWATIPNKPNDGTNEIKNSINNENQC
jgi:hypothetical protein